MTKSIIVGNFKEKVCYEGFFQICVAFLKQT